MPSSLLQVANSLLTACEQICNKLFADLLQAVPFYACSRENKMAAQKLPDKFVD
jgi:hypothetical protein